MSLYDVYDLCEYAKTKLNNLIVAKETCQATTVRQEAIAKINDEVDVIFIVGDPHSNNTKKLASIAHEKANKDTYMIESVNDIDISMLKEKHAAAVSSGASTPTYLTNQVIEYLRQFDYQNVSTHPKPKIDLAKII
jgi:4-hydroxy-3-methylbut-2-enyl diphosphate reductase